MAICPVSHIPLDELRMAVVFRNSNVVYEAEYIVRWLRHSLKNPMTNEILRSDLATNLLLPVRLPHMSERDVQRTARFLKLQGRVTASVSRQETIHVVLGFAMLALTWMFNLYWFAAVVNCLEGQDDYPCLWLPLLFFSVQMVACVCTLCVFPRAGFWGAFREVVHFFLFMLVVFLTFWLLTSCRVVRLYVMYRENVQQYHILSLPDRISALLMSHCAALP